MKKSGLKYALLAVTCLGGIPAYAQVPPDPITTYEFGLVNGDCTATSSGVITCTKTGGVAFAPSATHDTTNAANITSGTLSGLRLPAPTASSLGGILGSTGASGQFVNGVDASGNLTYATPSGSGGGGSGTVTSVGLALPPIFSVTGSPVTTSGTLSATLASQSANQVFAAPSGSAGAPGFRALTGADLPAPTATTLGGVASASAPTNQFQTGIDTSGAPTFAQPSASNVSGLAASATTDTTNAANITSGSLPAARLPAPTTSALGGVESASAPANQFQTGINASGVPTFAQPAASNVSGLAPSATTDATNAANITSGTLPAARLPVPTATTLGGVESAAAAANQFQTGINASGVPTFAQPSASNVSGLAASATTDTTNAANISSGTLPAARLPAPTASTLGGVGSSTAPGGEFVTGVDTTGALTFGTPSGGASVPGTAGQIVTANGSGGFGTSVTPNIVFGCGAANGTIGDSLSGTVAASEVANGQTASYTLVSTDCGKLVTMNDASANTLTLNNFSAGNYVNVVNFGAGTMTLAAGVGTIKGPTSLAQNQSAHIVFDASNNWDVLTGAGSGGGGTGTPYQGPLLPSSTYVGGASGNLSANYYIPTTNTNGAGAFEGTGVVASLAADAPLVLQFNMPEVIPTGKTLKLRALGFSPATAGVAKFTVTDGATSVGSNIGATTLNSETQVSQTWSAANVIVEDKVTLTTAPTANQILTAVVTFNHTGWTLASQSAWQFSLVWE